MDEDNFDDVLINIELEGWFFYVDSSNRNDYFIAYKLIVIASDSDNEDCEGELYCQLKSALSDENLIFTTVVGANDETHRIVGLPQIDSFEFENGSFTLLEDTNIVEAIEFFKNMKTIDFLDLKSIKIDEENNFKFVKSNVIKELAPIIIQNNVVTDIDGGVYNGVEIGTQLWTTENLNVSKYRNGDDIPQVQNQEEWVALTTGAWCYYNNDPKNGAIYGKLYNWYAVNDPRGLAPKGFHIPSDNEWTTLINYLGGERVMDGGKTKIDPMFWTNLNKDATSESGFKVLQGGVLLDGTFRTSISAFWWSCSKWFEFRAWLSILNNHNGTAKIIHYNNQSGFPVRCLRD